MRAVPGNPRRTMMHDSPTLALEGSKVTVFQAAESQSRPCLVVYSRPDPGQRFELADGRHVIGRGEQADLRIDGVGLSRVHAQLDVSDQAVVLRDLGSANSSFVNEAPVTAPVTLRDGDILRLANVVLRFHASHSVEAALHERLYRLATTDPGTSVVNRRQLEQALSREFRVARRRGEPLALLCADLDNFKAVNDTHGHLAGDHVLRVCAALLRAAIREGDLIGRWGGEEFLIVAPSSTLGEAMALAERVRTVVADHVFELDAGAAQPPVLHRQTLSVGVAALRIEMDDEWALVAEADARLYAAKRSGRNRVVGSSRS